MKPLASVPPPEHDRHTNLGGVLNRMLGNNYNEEPEVEHGLFNFNAVIQIFEKSPGKYRDIKPRFHAELEWVVPELHQNVWTNWGPPLVENFSKFNATGRQQLDLLNKMIQGLHELVINQALGQSSVSHRHPDSKTGIIELQSGSSALAPIIVRQEIECKDAYVDRQNKMLKDECGGRSIGSEILRDIDEESDLEGGGV
ncbi:hypothetical protein N7471_010439 [Penicillium samsonianum]|uniref:uncharacterized protein n=1 Tax=Penicillium samsonianum TaxID=1882272 RepID=UPI002546608B|nr:uncharacterized protein N7471_010439 [Penicillium samsonianum]KAJ6125946.1 hypothetical protein N7471_010439 [Penicillium samsonianum]